jgi:nucleoside transporter
MRGMKVKLSLMMFFQYMLFAVWWVPLAAYLTNMNVDSMAKSLILSSMAIGCMASPIIGMVADRYFASQKLLALLNLFTGIFLVCAGISANPNWLFIFLLAAMFFHMPTWGLTSSVAMKHSFPEIFPRIRVFGSIGWVASGIFSLVTVHILKIPFDGSNLPFFFGAGVSFIASLQNFDLPNTPPMIEKQRMSVIDGLGFRTVKLMTDRNFAVFIIFSFLSMIPFSMYWSYCSEFLLDKKIEHISVMMNFGQLAEMLFLISVPFAIKKIGLRNTIITGLVFLFIRYATFYFGSSQNVFWLYLIGVIVHGLIFGYFYLGGQIYIDKKAPEELKAQAQGFIFFVTFGVGLLAGNFISGQIIEKFTEVINNTRVYDWGKIWGATLIEALILLILFSLMFKNEKIEKIETSNLIS